MPPGAKIERAKRSFQRFGKDVSRRKPGGMLERAGAHLRDNVGKVGKN